MTPAGRTRLVASHLTFADLGPVVVLGAAGLAAGLAYGLSVDDLGQELPRVLAAAMAQLPAVWVLAGIATALFGVLPRFAASVGWGVLAACVLLGQFGELLRLDQWMLDLSPFAHLPKLPGGDVSAAPLVWLTLIAATLATVGLLGFRKRDVPASG